ncbi:M23 family metallopeptidase [Vallitalea okinawensis]|uniref:M23 family metallopeptidase n=1 Tax=Vallitalea okinawensis TaxID=2078660 RepID=UPI000CFD19DF|nr:M23 family metallopeptidase [Vallitalea okinawensis]
MSRKHFNRFKENGFYILLLSSIVVITLLLTFISIDREPEVAEEPKIDLNEEKVAQNTDQEPTDETVLDDNQDIDMESVTNLTGNSELGDNLLVVKEDQADDQAPPKEDEAKETATETPADEEEQQEKEQEEEAKETFSPYDNSQNMLWPVTGDVVMDFSMDASIYDSTLDLYRTNDALCIQANVGADVIAAADGSVESITKTEEEGTMIVIDHGEGWKTTYEQLSEEVNVSQGQVVQKGEVIGQVAEPTMFALNLGSHVGFRVMKDNGPCNPSDHLVQ